MQQVARTPYPCETDATSLVGLRPLQREHRNAWAMMLRTVLPTKRVRNPTFADFLRSGCDGALLPPNRTWREQRGAAARWLPHIDEDLRLESVTGAVLLEIIDRGIEAVGVGSAERFKKDCRFVRQWGHDGQKRRWGKFHFKRAWKRIPVAGTEVQRADPPLSRVVEIIAGSADPKQRVQIGLALGCRLTTGEIEALSCLDFNPDWSRFRVSEGCRRGVLDEQPMRDVHVPPWLIDLMVAAWGATPPAEGWLFPHRDDPRRHTTTAGDRLRTLRKRLDADWPTFGDLRNFGQRIVRACGGARASVRGAITGAVAQAAYEREQAALAKTWIRLDSPPHPGRPLPSRAPKGCAPQESELSHARRRARERFGHVVTWKEVETVPASCRASSGPRRPLVEQTALERRFKVSVAEIETDSIAIALQREVAAERRRREAAEDKLGEAAAEVKRMEAELLTTRKVVGEVRRGELVRTGDAMAFGLATGAVGMFTGMKVQEHLDGGASRKGQSVPSKAPLRGLLFGDKGNDQ